MAETPITPVERRRQAALVALERFAELNGVTRRGWVSADEGDVIALTGIADDGRRFGIKYLKETQKEQWERSGLAA